MSHLTDPGVGFNDIPFSHQSDRGRLSEWKVRPIQPRKKVAGRSLVKRQFRGFDSDVLTLKALLPGRTEYRQLLAAITNSTIATLRLLPEAMLDADPERIKHVLGTDYLLYPNTSLVAIDDVRPLRDGRALCTLTFERDHEEVE